MSAAVQLGEGAHQGEAEAGAAGLLLRVAGLLVRIAQPLEVLRRDADAGVGDDELESPASPRMIDRYLTAAAA